MKKTFFSLFAFFSISLFGEFTLSSPAFKNNHCLPQRFTYCRAAKKGQIEQASDVSPPLIWKDPPSGTRSFALIVTDPDAVNLPYFDLPHHEIKEDAPRVTVYHWVLVNISSKRRDIPEGAGSEGFVEGGKPIGKTPYGLTGMNVYTDVFKSFLSTREEFPTEQKEKMEGIYGDYDGGCPPWNDQRIHRYTYTLYALDVEELDLPKSGKFTGPDAMKAMQGHILGEAKLVGLYSTNRRLIRKGYCPCSSKNPKRRWGWN